MDQKNYARFAGLLFSLIALSHLLRIAFGWAAVLNERNIPMWWSWVAVVICGFLGYQGLRLSLKS